ncbi:MAG: ATP-binding protein, partial [bacterium]
IFRLKKKDGSELWVEDHGHQVFDSQGRIYYEGVLRDITERKRAQDQIKQQNEFLNTILESLTHPFYVVDANDYTIQLANSAARLGNLSEQPTCYALTHRRDRACGGVEHRCPIEEVRRTKASVTVEHIHYDAEGNARNVEVHCHPIFDSEANLSQVIEYCIDITERKRAEEEKSKLEARLRQAQKMEALGTLAGGIAHDFNNLLWVIMGNTEMSLRKLPEDSPVRTKQQEILTASKRAQKLIEQILTFSRHQEQERRPVQIHLIVKEVLRLLEATLPPTIEIRQNIDEECGSVVADPTRIHQMIMNLCTNAYQAMGENGGLLEVSLGVFKVNARTIKSSPELQKGSYVELTISDTGCGMDKATMERIFDPFFTTKEVGQGTGLGLATVHGIVTSLGGAIRVYSEAGKGSTFRVFLPRSDRSVSEEPTSQAESPEFKGKEHILVVDDEKQVTAMVRDMLEALGYDITAQTSGVEALEQFRAQPDKFDLVITDQTMPEMTGIELAEQVVHLRPDIPVILVTGFSKMVTEEKIKNRGIREYLKKPIDLNDLESVVRRVLEDKKD